MHNQFGEPLLLITQGLHETKRLWGFKMRINRHLFKMTLMQSYPWARLDTIWKIIMYTSLKITSLNIFSRLAKMSKKVLL